MQHIPASHSTACLDNLSSRQIPSIVTAEIETHDCDWRSVGSTDPHVVMTIASPVALRSALDASRVTCEWICRRLCTVFRRCVGDKAFDQRLDPCRYNGSLIFGACTAHNDHTGAAIVGPVYLLEEQK